MLELSTSFGYAHRKLAYDTVYYVEWLETSQYRHMLEKKKYFLGLAKLYHSVCRAEGATYPIKYARRASMYYERHFALHIEWNNANDYVEYIRMLINLGDYQPAVPIVHRLVTYFEHDDNIHNYLFYAGVVYKAVRDLEKANYYFFEASQLGPPKFFNKIEMMTIVSRTLEEISGENGEDVEDAYRMVILSIFVRLFCFLLIPTCLGTHSSCTRGIY